MLGTRPEGSDVDLGTASHRSVVVITTRGLGVLGSLRELWRRRGLVYFLSWRDVRIRYKQTLLGAGWAILQPLMMMAIFTVLFGRIAGVATGGVPYPLFALAGLVPWYFFAQGVTQASGSLVTNANMISKAYFPRLAVPLAGVTGAAVDLALSFTVLLGVMAFFGVFPGAGLILAIPFVALGFAVALGISLWLSALNVRYRDIRYVIPFLMQAWLLATPVGYPADAVPSALRPLIALNPMSAVTEGFRKALLGGSVLGGDILISTSVALLVLLSGLFYFVRSQRSFADVI